MKDWDIKILTILSNAKKMREPKNVGAKHRVTVYKALKGNFAKKKIYMFFLMYKYGCLYIYQRFIMLDKGLKSILEFGHLQMDVAILILINIEIKK